MLTFLALTTLPTTFTTPGLPTTGGGELVRRPVWAAQAPPLRQAAAPLRAIRDQAPPVREEHSPPFVGYAEGYRKALLAGKPLLVWVAYKCPSSANQLPQAVHAYLPALNGSTTPRVVGNLPDGRGGFESTGVVEAPDCCANSLRELLPEENGHNGNGNGHNGHGSGPGDGTVFTNLNHPPQTMGTPRIMQQAPGAPMTAPMPLMMAPPPVMMTGPPMMAYGGGGMMYGGSMSYGGGGGMMSHGGNGARRTPIRNLLGRIFRGGGGRGGGNGARGACAS